MFKLVCSIWIVAAAFVIAPGLADARCWHAPVSAAVADPFREPSCAWCAGNRGIEYATAPGDPVRAVATGRITFAGSIAGTVYVVVQHANGWRATYANLQSESFAVGDLVIRGSVVGRAAGHVHFGLRDGERYLDPAPHLGQLVGRPRLIPVDGTAPIPAGPPRLICDGPPQRASESTRASLHSFAGPPTGVPSTT